MILCLNLKCRARLPQAMQMNTASLRLEPVPPRMGDIGICGACGRIMIYIDSFSVRDPSIQEARLIGQNTEIMSIRQAILDRL